MSFSKAQKKEHLEKNAQASERMKRFAVCDIEYMRSWRKKNTLKPLILETHAQTH